MKKLQIDDLLTLDQSIARLAELGCVTGAGAPLSRGAWRAYVSLGIAPPETTHVGRAPLWAPADIAEYAATRPGPGGKSTKMWPARSLRADGQRVGDRKLAAARAKVEANRAIAEAREVTGAEREQFAADDVALAVQVKAAEVRVVTQAKNAARQARRRDALASVDGTPKKLT
jgi:hypothetical protein